MQGPLFLAISVNYLKTKQVDVVSKIAANIFPFDQYALLSVCLLLTNHGSLYS